VAIARHRNLKAARRHASRSGLFVAILSCVRTAISQLLIEILTSPLDTVIPIS